MKSKYFLGERIKLNDDKEIVLYINATSKLYVYIFLNSLEISRQDLQKIVNARFNCHIEIYESTYKNIKNYILSLDYTKYRLKYNCLICNDKIIHHKKVFKNLSIKNIINDELLYKNIFELTDFIDIIYINYEASNISTLSFIITYIITYARSSSNNNNDIVSIFFKE